MIRVLCAALLLFAASAVAQQQSAPPYNTPPGATPPTFPQDQRQPMPPDTKAPAAAELSNADVQQQVQHKLATEPLLHSLSVKASVDDDSLLLTGNVENEQQHRLALRIAESYSGEREIVDKITIREP